MGIKSPTNVSPYYDDFNINKNFHRVMFVPGLAVQTRELTQLQTILQNQIERVGDNLFVEGTILEGCDFQYETVPYVKLRDNDSGGNTVSVTAFANGIVEGLTSGVRAKIVATAEGAEASAPNYNTFLVKYIDGGTSKTNKTFANNEVLVFKPADGGSGQTANTISSGAFGTGSIFSTGEGLIYGKGFVVRSEPQTLVLERYSVSPSYKVGFDIEESFITSDNDSTLLDNAIGSYNETAPGAHRLKLTPTLVKRVLTDTANTSQLSPIFTVENGNIRVVKQTTVYDDIGREMANRTYEESGNYMVKHINTEVKEHLDTGTNFGRYSSTDLPAGDKNKLAIGITPGVAYVQGYRNEVLTTEYIDTDKATDTEQELGINVTTNYGNYVIVNELAGPWDPTEFETISLRNAAADSISSATLGSTAAPGSEIGTARVRHVAYRSGTKGKPDGQYRLYIFDVKMSSGTFADVRSFYVNNASGPDNFADAVLENGSAVLKEPSFNRVVFTTGAPAVQTLTNNVGTINTSYTFRDKSTVSFNTSGTATLSITGVHAGGTEEFPYGTGALNSTQKRDFMVIAGSTVQTTNNAGFASFTAGSNTIVGNGSSTFSSNYAVDDFIQFANTTGGGLSQIALTQGSSLSPSAADKLLIEFDYFEHDVSTGIGFFSVDSYVIDPNESTANTTSIVTPQIPRYNSSSAGKTFDLRNAIDFRPRISSTATSTSVIASATENPASSTTLDVDSDGSYVPVADENFESDLLYYLPRIDRVVMGKDGKKKVIKGIPAETPAAPLEPAESMTLSTLYIPPFPSLSLENSYSFNRVDQAVRVSPFFHKRYTMRDVASLEKRIDRMEYYTALNVLEKSAKDLTIADGSGLNRFKNGIFVDAFFGHNNANLLDSAYNAAIDTKKGELRPKFDQASLDLSYLSGSSTNVTRKGKQVRLEVTGNTVAYTSGDIVYVGATFVSATAAGTVRTTVANSSIVRIYLHNANGTFTSATTLNEVGSSGTSTISTVQYPNEGDLITLPFEHEIYIDQPYASELINPVGELSFNWVGNLDLFPEADHWVDTTQQPDVQWDLDLASNWQSLQNAWGTQWNEWNTTTSFRETERQVAVTGVNVVGGGDGNNPHGALDEVTIEQTDTTVRTGTRLNVEVFNRTQSSGPFVRRTDIIPFMRSREIQFQATGMRPNTRVYPYFDNVRVAEYTTPTTSAFANTGAAGAALVTNANGAVFGVFTLPNNGTLKFRQGERPFRLVDIANTATQSGTQTTSSETMYNSLGLAQATQGITLNTREARVTSDTVTDTRTVTSSFTGLQVHRDPVAQSFRIGDFEFNSLGLGDNSFGLGADGVFVSCIDLYFAQKSETNGIGIEIREMVNGQITAVRVPFGWKRIDPADVNVASDGSAPTPFYFDQPVYLRGDKEYAFIVKPDGSDPNYRLWISTLGGTDTVTGAIIDQQPAVGLLFTSANDRTYTPRQNQDICFTIWRADFNTSVSGTAIFNNDDDEYLNIEQISSSRFQIGEKVRGESLLTISGNTAAFTIGDNVTFGANTGQIRKIIGSTIIKTDIKGVIPVGANVVFSGTSTYYATANAFTSNTATGFVQYVNRGSGELTVNNSSGNFTSNTSINDGFYRGQLSNAYAQVVAIRDQKYDVLSLKMSEARYVDTAISWSTRTTSNTYTVSASYTNVENFENNDFLSGEKIVASRTNEVNNTSSAKTLYIRGVMSSNTARLTPVIDIGRTKSVITIHNIINNDNTGETGNFGNANARYIAKRVTLADGQEAEDLKVFVSAYKPAGAEIDVYARIQNPSDGDEFRDKQYTLLNQITASNTVSSIINRNDFIELEYGFPSANATSQSAYLNAGNSDIVRYYNSDGAYFDGFKQFAIKIVLRSSNGSHVIPRVKDLRTIALQS
jgi:hypothetical protein